MEGYRFIIVGLFTIGLVGVYADNHGDLSAQQLNERENRNATVEKSLLAIENTAVPATAEETPRKLKKRSNPNSYGGMSVDEYEFTMNEALGIFAREAVVSAAQRMKYRMANARALEAQQARMRQQQAHKARMMQQAQQARRAQQEASHWRAGQPRSLQYGQRPASPQFSQRLEPSQFGPRFYRH